MLVLLAAAGVTSFWTLFFSALRMGDVVEDEVLGFWVGSSLCGVALSSS